MHKILIVEDDKFLEDLESQKFTSEGFQVFPARSIQDVEAVLAENVPDIVLLDLVLPGVDGFEILKKLKSEEKTKNTPVIIFSNLSDKSDIERAKANGAFEYIVKANLTLNEIVQKIKETIEKHSPSVPN